ncbi:MAG: hypothetical protein J6Y80_04590 [Victivallales bacterium]|nr:hypothetical protein [Victivallales bacterium]
MNRHSCLLACLLLSALLCHAAEIGWDFTRSEDCGIWTAMRKNLTATMTADGLLLEVTGADSCIGAKGLSLATNDFGRIEIEYRAEGFEGGATTGQLFFASEAEPKFNQKMHFRLPSLRCDGRWHTITVTPGDIPNGAAHWKDAGTIISLRLDLADQAPGEITVKSLKLLPPPKSRAATLGMPESREVTLSAKDPDKGTPALSASSAHFTSPMVAPDGKFNYPGQRFIRIPFTLEQPVKRAFLQTACDDRLANIFLNGKKLEHKWSTEWRTTDKVDLDAKALLTGKNLLAVEYSNHDDIGGLMLDLQLILKDGSYRIVTAADGLGEVDGVPADWMKPEFDDSAWAPCETRPGAPNPPWTFAHEYTSIDPSRFGYTVALRSQDGAAITVAFSGVDGRPIGDNERLYTRLYSDRNVLIDSRIGTPAELGATREADGTVVLVVDDCGFLRYGQATSGHWQVGVDERFLEGANTFDFQLPDRPMAGQSAELKLQQVAGAPVPMLNGNPFYFSILTIVHFNVPTGMEGPGSPFNLITTRIGGWHGRWWIGPDEYDFAPVDRQLNMCLARYPNAMLGLFVWCQPGKWYQDLYPERCSLAEDSTTPNQYYVAAVSFSNPEYQADACRAVKALIQHVEKYYGPRIVLYNLMGGYTCEWQGWNCHTALFADYNPNSIPDFQRYAQAHGKIVDHIPTRAERTAGLPGGIFRDPVRDWMPMLYDDFYNAAMAECVAKIAHTVREETDGRKLVGAYFGYHQEYGNLGYCVTSGGHNDSWRLIADSDMDFFLSPLSYGLRSLGAPSADMKPYAALRHNGKLSIMEDDTRTSLLAPTGFDQTLNLTDTINVLKRSEGMALARRNLYLQLPLVGGNEVAAPAIRQMMLRTMKVGQMLLEKPKPVDAEIAAVIDEKSLTCLVPTRRTFATPETAQFAYSNSNGAFQDGARSVLPLSGELLYFQRYGLSQLGAPVDVIMLEDVPAVADKYKMVVFLDAFQDSPLLRESLAALKTAGTTVVVAYGAGFMEPTGVDADAMSRLLGIQLAETAPGALRVEFPDGRECGAEYPVQPRFTVADTDAEALATYAEGGAIAAARKDKVFFYGGALLDTAFLREAARAAGVHIYMESGDNLFAGGDILSLHAITPGTKTIRLPRVTDAVEIYSGEVVGRATDTITLEMDSFETKVILLGDADEILKRLSK